MALGPGKYDQECTIIRVTCAADGALVAVFGGDRGTGFSLQATPQLTAALPRILRDMADEIEKSS